MWRQVKVSVLSFCLLIAVSFPTRADDWLGQDKALHFGASAGIATLTYILVDVPNRDIRLFMAAFVALGFGVGKEILDLDGTGDPSFKDLTWDLIGTLTGILTIYVIDLMAHPKDIAAKEQTTEPKDVTHVLPPLHLVR